MSQTPLPARNYKNKCVRVTTLRGPFVIRPTGVSWNGLEWCMIGFDGYSHKPLSIPLVWIKGVEPHVEDK